jgi:tripartite-type tricarboxylate transporter receptor subunit TctC
LGEAAATALPLARAAFTDTAFAQAGYPNRNITMIVPFPAGSQADLAARPVALERILGKPVIVDNRAGGAGGSIGNAQAVRAEAVKVPEVTRTFETAGSPVAYLDAPEFSKFVADDSARLIAAVKKIGKVE